jgi:hypothetical protein
METPATTVYVKKWIHIPERYEDENYRREVYERWMAEWMAARAQLSDINNSPFYGQGWRAD